MLYQKIKIHHLKIPVDREVLNIMCSILDINYYLSDINLSLQGINKVPLAEPSLLYSYLLVFANVFI